MPALPFDIIHLGEDLLHNALGKVLLNLFNLLIRGKFFTKRSRGKGQVVAALPAELIIDRVFIFTILAYVFQFGSTFPTELSFLDVFKLAFRTFHRISPVWVKLFLISA